MRYMFFNVTYNDGWTYTQEVVANSVHSGMRKALNLAIGSAKNRHVVNIEYNRSA